MRVWVEMGSVGWGIDVTLKGREFCCEVEATNFSMERGTGDQP